MNQALHLFGDQQLKIDVEVTAPLGTRLTIFATVFQTASGGLVAPLWKDIQVSQKLHFDARTALISACTLPGLPAVRRPTRMLVKLSVRIEGQADAQPAGSVDLFVYPRHSPAEWKKAFAAILAQGGLERIGVFGKQSELRAFLTGQQIRFDDLGNDWPETLDARTLYLGDSLPPTPDRLTGAHVALFLSNAAGLPTLPGVYSVADTTGGTAVKVTLPAVFDQLDNNPRNQQTFLEIVRQALNPRAPMEDSTSTWP